MKIITLDQIEFSKIVDCFNLSFSDYFIKFVVDEAYLKKRWHGANIHLSLSAGVLDGEDLVGFIVIGIGERNEKKASYNGGTGVIPSHRGRGYTSKMYEFLLPKFKSTGVKCHLLEVIQENVKAIHLYEKAGLKIDRGINSYSGEISFDQKINKGVQIKEMEELDWKLMNSFHDYIPTWDFSNIAIIRNKNDYQYFGAFQDGKMVGYAIMKTKDGMVMQFGVNPKLRRKKIGSTLFLYLKNIFPKIKIVNIDDRNQHVIKFAESLGLVNSINQFEMVSYLQ